jgi:hypothetical protein
VLDLVLAITAPSSAVAGLWFWQSHYGALAWKALGIVAACVAVTKPLMHMTRRIKDMESALQGYRMLEYDLTRIKDSVEAQQAYDTGLRDAFMKALDREKELISKPPELGENLRLKRQCTVEVANELPANSFFVPEENHD